MAEGMNIKDTVIFELKVTEGGKPVKEEKKELEALATSILGVQQASKKLREERKLLDFATADGAKRITEINKALEENDKKIKSNSTALEKQRLNIGNYKSAFDGIEGQVTGLTGKFAALLNPVTAFAAAGAGLLKLYTSSTTGAKDLARAQDTLSSAYDVAAESVGNFFSALMGQDQGGPGIIQSFIESTLFRISPALLAITQASSAAKETLRELEISSQFAKQFAKDDERRAEVFRRIRDDDTRSINERADAARKINAILENSGERTVIVLQAQISAIKTSTANYNNNREAQLKVAQLEAEIADKREEITGKLTENVTALKNLEISSSDEARAARIANLDAWFQHEHDQYLRQLEFIKTFNLDVEADVNNSLNKMFKAREDQKKKETNLEKKAAQDQIKIEEFKNQALIGGVHLITKEKSSARFALTSIFKADAIKETTIATKEAAVLAYKSLAGIPYVGPILGGLAAAAVAAFGLNSIAQMTGIQFDSFAQGGQAGKRGTFYGKSHASGGIDYIRSDGGHRINVEHGEDFFVLKKSASEERRRLSMLNVRHGGNSWEPRGTYAPTRLAEGGFIPTPTTSTTDIERVVRAVMQSMPPIVVAAQDVFDKANTDNQITNRARVL